MDDVAIAAIAFVHVVARQERALETDAAMAARLNALIETARDLEQEMPPLPNSVEEARDGR